METMPLKSPLSLPEKRPQNYVYVNMYICIYVYMCICIYNIYVYMYIYVYMCICIYAYLHICVYVYMYICVSVYVYMYICIHFHSEIDEQSISQLKALSYQSSSHDILAMSTLCSSKLLSKFKVLDALARSGSL